MNELSADHVKPGIAASLVQWRASLKKAYCDATKGHQPGIIYRQVLLACSLSEADQLGYFTAANVRTSLRDITGRECDIPNFTAHLKQFSEALGRDVLLREGQQRRWR